MKITVIYGTPRKARSTTYQLAQLVINALADQDEVVEFFLPKDMPHFCTGCFKCIEGQEEKCLAYTEIKKIREAMNTSQLIIFTVPVYVYHAPGQVKALLDHFAWEWMVHRPNEQMFKKQVLIVSTAAGAGMKSAIKDVKDSMDFWGVAKVYSYKKAVQAGDWGSVSEQNKKKMSKAIVQLVKQIKQDQKCLRPRIKVKMLFHGCRLMQKYVGISEIDKQYWQEKGWLAKQRPWQ